MSTNLITILASKDINSTKNFYEFLGFKLILEKHGNGPQHFSISLNNVVFEIYPESSTVKEKIYFLIWVDDIEKCAKGISIYGGKLLEGITEKDGVKRILVEDADGRIIRIMEK